MNKNGKLALIAISLSLVMALSVPKNEVVQPKEYNISFVNCVYDANSVGDRAKSETYNLLLELGEKSDQERFMNQFKNEAEAVNELSKNPYLKAVLVQNQISSVYDFEKLQADNIKNQIAGIMHIVVK